jgi:P27 family predicted phage terminase small subunit
MRLLQGNAGKRPLPVGEASPAPGLPDPPAHLNDIARACWFDMGRKLADLRLMTEIDVGQLALYCVAWGRWCEAEENLRRFGTIISGPNRWPVQSPYLAIANKAMEQMQRALVEFGMSPSSRTRARQVSPAKPQSKLARFLDGTKT